MARNIKDFLDGVANADEVAKVITENLKEAGCKVFIDDGKDNIYVPKSRLDAKILELKDANETIGELDKTIKGLESSVKDNDKAQLTITDLQGKIADYDKKVKEMQVNQAVQLLAHEFKAKDLSGKDLLAFLDSSKITIAADGSVNGIKEQVEALKASKDYLFEAIEDDSQNNNKGFKTGNPGKPSSSDIFNSKTLHNGDFGKMLGQQNKPQSENKVDSDYFFK